MNEGDVGATQTHQPVRKRRVLLAVLLVIALIGGIFWLVVPPREPSYHGKPLSYWLARAEELTSPRDRTNLQAIECRDAVRTIGTNAIPFLLRMLRAKDSALKIKLMDLIERQDFIHISISSADEPRSRANVGFYFLGELATNAVPGLVDIYKHPASPHAQGLANEALVRLYPSLRLPAPYWVPPEDRPQWFVNAGADQFVSDSPSNAINAIFLYSEAIRLAPTNAGAYLGRGQANLTFTNFTKRLKISTRL